MRWSQIPPRAFALLIFTLVVFFASHGQLLRSGGVKLDYTSFYTAGQVAAEGGNFYEVNLLRERGSANGVKRPVLPYLYPPLLAQIHEPLSAMPIKKAQRVWTWLSVGALIAAAYVSFLWVAYRSRRRFGSDDRALTVVGGLSVLLLMSLPLANNLALGQVNPFVLLCLALAFYFEFRWGGLVLAGFFVAAAAMLKATPVIFLLYFALRNKRRALVGFGIGIVVLGSLSWGLGGWEPWAHFIEFLPRVRYGAAIPGLFDPSAASNFSIAGFASRALDDTAAIPAFTYGALGLLALLAAFVTRRAKAGTDESLLLTPFLVLMVVASPYAYLHHLVYILPGLLALTTYVACRVEGGRRLSARIAIAFATVLLCVDLPLFYNDLLDAHPADTSLRSLNLYALLVLFGIGCALVWATSRGRVRAKPRESAKVRRLARLFPAENEAGSGPQVDMPLGTRSLCGPEAKVAPSPAGAVVSSALGLEASASPLVSSLRAERDARSRPCSPGRGVCYQQR